MNDNRNMDIINQIKNMCNELYNSWFPDHEFTKIALFDLENEHLNEEQRHRGLEELGLTKRLCIPSNYDENGRITQSRWIIPDKINGVIPGFILLRCDGGAFCDEGFDHEIYFTYIRPEYRRRGILKNMINDIPLDWNIWLEADSRESENIEEIWEKCGFSFHKNYKMNYGSFVKQLRIFKKK